MISQIIIIGVVVIACLLGIVFSIWTVLDTRKKYYEDYIRRKR